jgi:hypothetical protein
MGMEDTITLLGMVVQSLSVRTRCRHVFSSAFQLLGNLITGNVQDTGKGTT